MRRQDAALLLLREGAEVADATLTKDAKLKSLSEPPLSLTVTDRVAKLARVKLARSSGRGAGGGAAIIRELGNRFPRAPRA